MSKKKTPEAEAKTKEELLSVAIRVFLRDGYEAASMKAIAKEGDCTTGKLYSNFSKKEDLLLVFTRKAMALNIEKAKNIMKDGDPEIMVYLIMCALLLETCALNDHFRELYYVGYTSLEVAKNMIYRMMDCVRPMLKQYHIPVNEDDLYANCLMNVGMMRSMIVTKYFDRNLGEDKRIEYLVRGDLRVFGVPEKDIQEMIEKLNSYKNEIHDEAYAIIIQMLSGKI